MKPKGKNGLSKQEKKDKKNPFKSSLTVGRSNVLLIPFSCLILILINN